MTATAMSIHTRTGENLAILPLDRATRDALAVYVQQTFPVAGRRKAIAREWDLTVDEARAVIEGRASGATIDRIWKHPRGGWRVLLPVMGAVIGQSVDGFIHSEHERLRRERDHQEAQTARLAAMGRDLLLVVGVGPGRAGGAAVRVRCDDGDQARRVGGRADHDAAGRG